MNPTMKRNLEDEGKHKKIDMWYHYYNNINAECTLLDLGQQLHQQGLQLIDIYTV